MYGVLWLGSFSSTKLYNAHPPPPLSIASIWWPPVETYSETPLCFWHNTAFNNHSLHKQAFLKGKHAGVSKIFLLCCPACINFCLYNFPIVFRDAAPMPAVVPHLLGIVYEGIVWVDKEDVLRLQVGVSQLVVMENCSGEGGVDLSAESWRPPLVKSVRNHEK